MKSMRYAQISGQARAISRRWWHVRLMDTAAREAELVDLSDPTLRDELKTEMRIISIRSSVGRASNVDGEIWLLV